MNNAKNACAVNGDGSMYRVVVGWDKQAGCEARIRDRAPITIDMPVRHGGTGENPCPLEILFSAVGSCFLGTFLVFLRQLKLKLDDLRVSVGGSIEESPDTGKYDITAINVHVKVALHENENKRDIVGDCIRLTVNHCPTTRALQGNVPMTITSEITTVPESARPAPDKRGSI